MIEVRFHGRGGQGAVLASELLAQAAFQQGLYPQSFPFFGVERRGAPVTAFARIAAEPIAFRTRITEPDIVVVLEPGLFRVVPVADGLKPPGLLLVNTPRPPEDLETSHPGPRATVDATAIARRLGLGPSASPIVNTAMLGALAESSRIVGLAALDAAIAAHLRTLTEANREAAREGAAAVRRTEARPLLAGVA